MPYRCVLLFCEGSNCVQGDQSGICPTGTMLTDYFTKPLQGALFIKFRDRIINSSSEPAWHIMQDHRSVLCFEWSWVNSEKRCFCYIEWILWVCVS